MSLLHSLGQTGKYLQRVAEVRSHNYMAYNAIGRGMYKGLHSHSCKPRNIFQSLIYLATNHHRQTTLKLTETPFLTTTVFVFKRYKTA